MLIDYHLHNHFSPDSEADSAEIIQAEKKHGIKEVCLTNHAEWFERESGGKGVFDIEEATRRFESIKWEIDQLKGQFPDFPIKFGTEVTFNEKILNDLDDFISKMDFDFVLGSVHNLDDQVVNSSRSADAFFTGREEGKTYKQYFDELDKLVDWGNFNVVAHFDVIKKHGVHFFGPFNPEKYEANIKPVLKKIAAKGIGLELNTQSIDKACKEIFPHPIILRWAVEAGIKHFTLGSDSHKAQNAGKHLDLALKIAKEAGITHISTYSKRKPILHQI